MEFAIFNRDNIIDELEEIVDVTLKMKKKLEKENGAMFDIISFLQRRMKSFFDAIYTIL